LIDRGLIREPTHRVLWTIARQWLHDFGVLLVPPATIAVAFVVGLMTDFGERVDLSYYRALAPVVPTFLIAFFVEVATTRIPALRDMYNETRELEERYGSHEDSEVALKVLTLRMHALRVAERDRFIAAVPTAGALLAVVFVLYALGSSGTTTFLFLGATLNAGVLAYGMLHTFFSRFPETFKLVPWGDDEKPSTD
jgi:hypothetical protein